MGQVEFARNLVALLVPCLLSKLVELDLEELLVLLLVASLVTVSHREERFVFDVVALLYLIDKVVKLV